MTRIYTETEVVARVGGLTQARLRRYAEAECVRPSFVEGRPVFAEHDVARLELICELGADFELDEEAAALVLSLLDQIHGLRRELRGLAEAVAAEPAEVRRRIAAALAARRRG